MTYYEETLQMIEERKEEIAEAFQKECLRLLKSGALDRQDHKRGLLFGVALENISENYTPVKNKEYKNLKAF